jgi:sarcosine oxidase subunit alpha
LVASGRSLDIDIELDGERMPAVEGEPVAISIVAAGTSLFSRSIKYHRPRGAFCLAGSCGQCLMRVDGVPNVFTCQVKAHARMRLERQNAFPNATLDVFSSVDFFFPRGLDPHHLLAGVPIAQDVMARVTRQLAGLGKLPDQAAPPSPPTEVRETAIAIVGGGISGQAAAQWLQAHRADYLLCEREPRHGEPSMWVLGLYEDSGGHVLLVRRDDDRLIQVRAKRIVLACGGQASLLPFENNDLPGIYSMEALERLIAAGVEIGRKVVLLGQDSALESGERSLRSAGIEVARVVHADRVRELEAHGDRLNGTLNALTYVDAKGTAQRVPCDVLGICLPPAPSFELARQGGASVDFQPGSGGFVVRVDKEGRSHMPHLFAIGLLAGHADEAAARESGERAAQAAFEDLG